MSSILHLYRDLWSSISSFLDIESLAKLNLIGNAQISLSLQQTVRFARLHSRRAILDIETILDHCRRYESLKELSISHSHPYAAVLRPKEGVFPPIGLALTSLTLQFNGASALAMNLPLSTLAPGLLTLNVVGEAKGFWYTLEQLSLPPNLESLTLDTSPRYPVLFPEFVGKLPRSLTHLDIACLWPFSDDLDDVLPVPQDIVYEWPPDLHSFRCPSDFVTIVLEFLPRTISRLDLSGNLNLRTNFATNSQGLVFPWRRFFPNLTALLLNLEEPDLDMDLLLATIVMDTELDSTEVDAFIASGFWNVTPLRHFQGQFLAYPSFTELQLPLEFWQRRPQVIIQPMLMPVFHSVEFLQFRGEAAVAMQLWATKKMSITNGLMGKNRLSSSVTSVCCVESLDVANISPNVTHLEGVLRGSGEMGALSPKDALPPNLIILGLGSTLLSPETLFIFPISLTRLKIYLKSPETWTVVAERLVLLETLAVTLTSSWQCSRPLSKLASPHLTSLELGPDNIFTPLGKPALIEFFSSSWTFPPSLTHLELRGNGRWHSSILAVLPPTLSSLIIDTFTWTSSSEPYPVAVGKSPSELLLSLPQHLLSLRLTGVPEPNHLTTSLVSVEMVKFLPRTLTAVYITKIFASASLSLDKMDELPPNLLRGFIEGIKIPTPPYEGRSKFYA